MSSCEYSSKYVMGFQDKTAIEEGTSPHTMSWPPFDVGGIKSIVLLQCTLPLAAVGVARASYDASVRRSSPQATRRRVGSHQMDERASGTG